MSRTSRLNGLVWLLALTLMVVTHSAVAGQIQANNTAPIGGVVPSPEYPVGPRPWIGEFCGTVTPGNTLTVPVSPSCRPQLQYLKIYPDTHVSGGLDDLTGDFRSLLLWSTQERTTSCSVAFSLGFVVPATSVAKTLAMKLFPKVANVMPVVALLDPASGVPEPLSCYRISRQLGDEFLSCDLSATAVAANSTAQREVEFLVMIDVGCTKTIQNGVGGDAVAVSKVRLGPPRQPPPP